MHAANAILIHVSHCVFIHIWDATFIHDFAAAFPSVAHRWIFAVLRVCNIPDTYLRVIESLYFECKTYILAQGRREFLCVIKSGVLQGCPLSGSLFAIAIDPFLRLIDAALDHGRSGIVRACADDIGAVVSSSSYLQLIKPIFDLANAAAGLKTKPNKCVIVPIYTRCTLAVQAVWRDWLRSNLPKWKDFRVEGAAKYLGIFLGPSAGALQWREQASKWTDRSRAIASKGASAAISVFQYNTRAITTMSYIAQFFPPPEWVLQRERWCLAKIFHVPYRALPDRAFFCLHALGSVSVVSAEAYCKASLLRAATKTLRGWQGLHVTLQGVALEHLPFAKVLAVHLAPHFWDSNAIVHSLHSIITLSSSIPLSNTTRPRRTPGPPSTRLRFLAPSLPVPFQVVPCVR